MRITVRFVILFFDKPSDVVQYLVFRGYRRFQRDGNAFVTFSYPPHAEVALTQLKNAQLSGYTINVTSTSQLETVLRRSRGNKGREEAANRGIVTGTGPDAGVTERGRSVVISGLPGRWSEENLRSFLERKGFRLAGNDTNSSNVVKVEPYGFNSCTLVSHRFCTECLVLIEPGDLVTLRDIT